MPDDPNKGVSHAEFSSFSEYVNKRFDGMDRSMNDGFGEIKSAISRIQDSRATQWGPILSAVGLMVTIGTLAFAPLWMNMAELKDAFNAHATLDGHPRAMALHEQYGPRFESAKEVDQRNTHRLDKIDDKIGDITERIARREGNAFTADDARDLERQIWNGGDTP